MLRKRHLYAVLFGLPGFFLALLPAFALTAAVAGALWLFVFGDSPWPDWTGVLLPGVFLAGFLPAWVAAVVAGYRYGKTQEPRPGFDRKHVLIAALATLLPLALLLLQQLGTGNIGPRHDGVVCADYCTGQGYAGSSMPPRVTGDRSCSCLGGQGEEAVTVPLDRIR